MMKINILTLFILAFTLGSCKEEDDSYTPPYLAETTTIWGQPPHTGLPPYSAFTDLIRFENSFYCTFREGTSHIGTEDTPGKVRILKSADGITWSTIAQFAMSKKDIRDPKLSITPDKRIMLWMDVETYGADKKAVVSRIPFVSFSDLTGGNFSTPEEVILAPDVKAVHNWIWRITWHKGVGYGVDYLGTGPLTIVKTTDGKNFTKVSRIILDGKPNEATIRFDQNDKMYVLIRREELDQNGVLATSVAPYTEFQQTKLSIRLGGPDFIFLDNNTLCIGTRSYSGATTIGTAIFVTDLNGKVLKSIKLPSGGDSSYPGLVVHDGKLWISYYSSHYATAESASRIYLSKIPLNELK